MKFRKWVLTARQKRTLGTLGLVAVAVLAIGLYPPVLYVLLVAGVGWGLFKLVLRVRRDRSGETKTY